MTSATAPNQTILGVFNGDNASVTLLRNGRVEYSAQEERFNRVKLTRGYPVLAIEDCLKRTGLSPDDIDVVACGAWAHPDEATVKDYFASASMLDGDRAAQRLFSSLKADEPYKQEFFEASRRMFPAATLRSYDHHSSHAHTAFYPSSFDDAYVITADGRGDLQSTVVWKADRASGLTRVRSFSELKSLGSLYGQITGLLGFKPYRHEGKITGLAAFGEMTDLVPKIHDLIRFVDGDYVLSNEYRPFSVWDYAELKERCAGYSREDIAFAVQHVLERNILDLITHYVPAGSNVCLAGGTFGNVKLNQRIREHPHVKAYFVFPEMGDGGNSFGGAVAAAVEGGLTHLPLEGVYLGPDYDWTEEDLHGLVVERFDDQQALAAATAEMLEANAVVGVFTGRMEYGPRALGARSIMIAASDAEINKTVNHRLNRTEFMPVAPVTLAEHASEMYERFSPTDVNVRYMTTCYDCTDLMKKISPAVVHVDGTARPQLISATYGPPLYHAILQAYHARTGIPSLVNTSYNNHEEPIVCSPADAIDSLRKNNVDCIVTDGMIIRPR